METHLLDVFRTVAHLGSITAAARRLRFTQSAVSRQVGALEAEIGAPLFERNPRGVTLTAEGRALLPYADRILDGLVDARAAVAGVRTVDRLRIGAFPTAVADLVPRAMAGFRAEYPSIALALVEGRTPDLLERLTRGEADVAVVSSSPAEPIDPARFALRHLAEERFVVAVPARHPLAGNAEVRLGDLTGDAFVVGSATGEDALLRAALPPGFRPRVDLVAADWTGKLGLVAAGLGVALLPALAVRVAPADIRLLRLHPDDAPVRHIHAAVPAGRALSVPAGHFLDHLSAAARPA